MAKDLKLDFVLFNKCVKRTGASNLTCEVPVNQ